ncbi:MAG TPA: SPFH domain-containing protein [Acidimicrobiia bacterium]|nr:SPFH domain-containing protein [Acidimicrobiia bacterium]
MALLIVIIVVAVIVALVAVKSLHFIGSTQVGLVSKRFARRKLGEDNPIAFRGEAGYQATLLMPGLRFKLWPLFGVSKYPWVQVPAGEIGVVIAQVGAPLPIGAKSAVYKSVFENFSNLHTFIDNGGQKGVQRPVLPPGTLVPVHPVAFLVLTPENVYGVPVSPDLVYQSTHDGGLTPESFGLTPDQLRVVVITPQGDIDTIGIVTALEGEPLPSGDIASRLGGFADIAAMEAAADPATDTASTDAEIIEVLLGSKNDQHNNYQDFQRFLENGGKIGLQHDPLLYGAYLLNPFLVRVEMVPMLVVNQGQVAVVKAFVGLPTLDTSGAEFKFGSIVRPGHRGIWQEPLRTGKYPINPRVYAAEIVPTSILTLNWAEATSEAHDLDAQLSSIVGKSREGFVFEIDLQVQIHVPDTRAPKVISMVGTMRNLVSEVLQSAVGNHFRNTLQRLEAVRFIETRQEVQEAALEAITRYLNVYEVETKGVYIQDVEFPEELVTVLTRREIANQERATFEEQQRAQTARIEMEKAKGTADMQGQLASAQVGVEINRNRAQAREAEAQGEAAYVELTGKAEATKTEAIGLAEAKAVEALGIARATGFEQQRQALGPTATAVVAVANAVSEGHIDVMPDVLVTGGGGSFEGLAATLMRAVANGQGGGAAAGARGAVTGSTGNAGNAGNGGGGGGGPAEPPAARGEPRTPLEAEEAGEEVGPGSA